MALLEIGETYRDEFDDNDGTYHYPATSRGGDRDQSEIEATKNALRLGLPVFVVFEGMSQDGRPAKLASVKARPGQARFRFTAIKRYGGQYCST